MLQTTALKKADVKDIMATAVSITSAADAVAMTFDSSENATFSGNVAAVDLTVTGDDITMATNTAGHLLVGDGTNYNPVAVSGAATLAANGTVTIANNAILTQHIDDNQVTADQIAAATITTTQIAANTIATGNVADNAIDGTKIAQNSILTRHIDDAQVTADQLAADAVITAKILDANVTSGKIANNAILTQHIDDNQVTADQIADTTVTATQIANATITTTQIAANTIATGNVADNAIDGTKIASNSILTRHIDDDQVTGDQLADALTVVTSVTTPLVDAAIVDGENFKVNGGQGSDGQVLTSTGSGVAWEDASGGSVSAVANGANDRIATFSSADALNGEANLTFDGSKILTISGTGSGDGVHLVVNNTESGGSPAGVRLLSQHGNWEVYNSKTVADALEFVDDSAGATRAYFNNAGHLVPGANNTYDLGLTATRWRNIYTNDLHLSNEGGDANEVDGTTGNWTIQEGNEDLFIINRKSGKKYKFKLEEM